MIDGITFYLGTPSPTPSESTFAFPPPNPSSLSRIMTQLRRVRASEASGFHQGCARTGGDSCNRGSRQRCNAPGAARVRHGAARRTGDSGTPGCWRGLTRALRSVRHTINEVFRRLFTSASQAGGVHAGMPCEAQARHGAAAERPGGNEFLAEVEVHVGADHAMSWCADAEPATRAGAQAEPAVPTRKASATEAAASTPEASQALPDGCSLLDEIMQELQARDPLGEPATAPAVRPSQQDSAAAKSAVRIGAERPSGAALPDVDLEDGGAARAAASETHRPQADTSPTVQDEAPPRTASPQPGALRCVEGEVPANTSRASAPCQRNGPLNNRIVFDASFPPSHAKRDAAATAPALLACAALPEAISPVAAQSVVASGTAYRAENIHIDAASGHRDPASHAAASLHPANGHGLARKRCTTPSARNAATSIAVEAPRRPTSWRLPATALIAAEAGDAVLTTLGTMAASRDASGSRLSYQRVFA